MKRIVRYGVAGLALALLVACTSDDDDAGVATSLAVPQTTQSVSSTTAGPVSTSAPATTAAATTTAVPPPTTAVAPSTTPTTSEPVCGAPVGNTNPKSSGFSETSGVQLSGLIGKEAEIGDHVCYERYRLTLQPDPSAPAGDPLEPGWRVRYTTHEDCSNSGEQTSEVPGTHFLCVDIGVWLVSPEGTGGLPEAMRTLINSGGDQIAGVALVENFEGQSRLIIGVNGELGFRVGTLSNPYRLYVDVGTEYLAED